MITVALDFGDSLTAVQAANFTSCQVSGPLCLGGSFDSKSSSTVVTDVLEGFNDTWVAGNLITDVIQLGYDPTWGAVSVAGMRFGLATSGDLSYGTADNLGLGYPINGDALDSPDLSFLGQLKEAGAINSRLFSMSLGDTGQMRC